MHGVFRTLGNLLVLTAILVGTSFFLQSTGDSSQRVHESLAPDPQAATATASTPPVTELLPTSVATPQAVIEAPVATTPTAGPRLPITRLVVDSIDLDTDVVAAPLVESNGAQTWQVPAFKAGHAENTAGAGQRGNAVLMGHVSSAHSGDVFKSLDRVQVGDQLVVFSGERRFIYIVYQTRAVPRTDLAMVEPTLEPIISLFTCTGAWDPLIWDFTERLFVRARLVG